MNETKKFKYELISRNLSAMKKGTNTELISRKCPFCWENKKCFAKFLGENKLYKMNPS